MIRIENLSFSYRRKKVIKNLDLCIEDGKRICISAPSGAGKTTLLRLIMNLEKPGKGTVVFDQKPVFSAVFQEDRLLSWKTVLENAAMFSDNETAAAVLKETGLEDCMNQYPDELSGGMKRRCALARALAHPFTVLILDEAFTGLDEKTKKMCMQAVSKRAEGKTLIMTAHDPEEAELLQAEIICL